jgi:hypothetical protein
MMALDRAVSRAESGEIVREALLWDQPLAHE